jgi:peptidoglycan/LPS O-acetylase OafA/YrhL
LLSQRLFHASLRLVIVVISGPMVRPQDKLPALDGLRGLGAVAVMLFHGAGYFSVPWLFRHGDLAVDLFFALSGYVVARSYETRMRDDWRGFALLRFRRLWPVLVVGVSVGAAAGAVLGVEHIPTLAAAALLCFPLFASGPLFPLNNVEWSLMCELVANIAHCALVRWLTPRRLAALVAVCWAGSMIAVGFDLMGPHGRGAWGGLARIGFGYFAGVLLYRLEHRLPRPRLSIWLVLLPLTAILLPHGQAFRPLLGMGTVTIMPLVVWLALGARVSALEARVAGVAADLSYPLYFVHLPILVLAHHFAPEHGAMARAAFLAGGIAVSLVAAVAALHLDRGARRAWPRPRVDAASTTSY